MDKQTRFPCRHMNAEMGARAVYVQRLSFRYFAVSRFCILARLSDFTKKCSRVVMKNATILAVSISAWSVHPTRSCGRDLISQITSMMLSWWSSCALKQPVKRFSRFFRNLNRKPDGYSRPPLSFSCVSWAAWRFLMSFLSASRTFLQASQLVLAKNFRATYPAT